LTGAPASDRLVTEPTVVYTSKRPGFPADILSNPSVKSLEIEEDTSVLIITTNGGKYKLQCKDHTQGGTFQTEQEFGGLGTVNITHILAPGVFYFTNPFTGKVRYVIVML
jgi:hypothetical protein